MGVYVVPERVAQALDKMVPEEQLSVIVSRPELADFLLWVDGRMEHARGATQYQQVCAAFAPQGDRDGDFHLGAVLQDASSRGAS